MVFQCRCSYRSHSVFGGKGEEVRHYQGHPQCFSKQFSRIHQKKQLFFKTCTCIINPEFQPRDSHAPFYQENTATSKKKNYACCHENSIHHSQPLEKQKNLDLHFISFGNSHQSAYIEADRKAFFSFTALEKTITLALHLNQVTGGCDVNCFEQRLVVMAATSSTPASLTAHLSIPLIDFKCV